MNWDQVAVALIAAGLVLVGVVFGWEARRLWVRGEQRHPTKGGTKFCDLCGDELPKSAIRTAFGKWRCHLHKAIP